MSPVYARILDRDGEIDYPVEDAKQMEKDGLFRFVGMRSYNGIVEYVFLFE